MQSQTYTGDSDLTTGTIPWPKPKSAFSNVTEMRQANEHAGYYWFSPDTMRCFKSRILAGILTVPDGSLFVTSESGPSGIRRYSVAWIGSTGVRRGYVERVGEFQAYATAVAARKAASLAAASWSGIDNA